MDIYVEYVDGNRLGLAGSGERRPPLTSSTASWEARARLLVRQLGTVLGHGSLVTGYGGLAWREGHMSFCRSWGSSRAQTHPNASALPAAGSLPSAFCQLQDTSFFVTAVFLSSKQDINNSV